MDDLFELTLEVSRVVNSSYDVSLQRLANVVSRCNNESLGIWAKMKACQVPGLAAGVLAGREQRPFTTGILAGLGRVPACRNAFLEADPDVLDKLLSRASSSPLGGQEIEAQLASLSMLSQPLLQHVGLPDSASAFVQILLEGVVACPNHFRLRAVHDLILGQSASILNLVTPEVVGQFASTCNRILRDNTDHMRGLLCLSIYAQTAKEMLYSPLTSSSGYSEPKKSFPFVKQWRDITHKIFVTEKARKTASLTVLRVLQFCCESSETPRDALEGVELCTRVIEAIDPTTLEQWVKENELLLKKLEVRLASGKIEKELKLAVLNIYVSLVCSDVWPLSVLVAVRAVLPDLSANSRQINVLSELREKALSSVLKSVWRSSERMDECLGLVDVILCFAIDQCQPSRPLSPQSFVDMNFASAAIATLRQSITTGTALPTQVVGYADTHGIPQWWNFDVFGPGASEKASDDGNGSQCSYLESEKLRMRLLTSMSTLFIEAALNSNSCPSHRRIPPAMLSALLQQLGEPRDTGSSFSCSYNGAPSGRTSPVSARGTMNVVCRSRGWRNSLAIEMQKAALDSHGLIIGHVNSICHDFEERCNTIKVPLREALRKAEALQNKLDSTNAELTATSREKTALKIDLQQAHEALDAETEEKARLLRRLDAAVAGEEMLTRALADCKKAVSDTEAEATHKLGTAKDFARIATDTMKADHFSKIERLEREMTLKSEKVSTLESDNKWMHDHIGILQEDLQMAQLHGAELKRQLHHQAETLSGIQLQEAESKQLLFERSTMLVRAVADATSLTASLASKGQEVTALLDQQRKCEAERQRLHHDLKEANFFKERIFATINHVGPVHSPTTDSLVSVIDITGPADEKSALLVLEQKCEESEQEL